MKYTDLNEYLYRRQTEGRPLRKLDLARTLGIGPSKLTALLRPQEYRPAVDDDLASKIAGVLNQPKSYVLKMYDRAA